MNVRSNMFVCMYDLAYIMHKQCISCCCCCLAVNLFAALFIQKPMPDACASVCVYMCASCVYMCVFVLYVYGWSAALHHSQTLSPLWVVVFVVLVVGGQSRCYAALLMLRDSCCLRLHLNTWCLIGGQTKAFCSANAQRSSGLAESCRQSTLSPFCSSKLTHTATHAHTNMGHSVFFLFPFLLL